MSPASPDSAKEPLHRYEESIAIAAPAAGVWSLVTAMERYGEWSSENQGGYWRKNADGVPGTGEVGDKFVGINRRDGVEWKALVEIVEREPERSFAFVTGGLEYNIALWRYVIEPSATGCVLTEQYELRNLSPLMTERGQPEIDQRIANMRDGVRATLQGIKATAESAVS